MQQYPLTFSPACSIIRFIVYLDTAFRAILVGRKYSTTDLSVANIVSSYAVVEEIASNAKVAMQASFITSSNLVLPLMTSSWLKAADINRKSYRLLACLPL